MALTTPIKGQFVIPRLTLDIFYLHTKFGNYQDIIAGIKTEMGYVTLATLLLGVFVIQKLRLNIVYLCAKFGDSSFSRSTDITGALKFKMVT